VSDSEEQLGGDGLERLAALLREQGGLLASLLVDNGAASPAARACTHATHARPTHARTPDARTQAHTNETRARARDTNGTRPMGPAQLAASGPRATGRVAEYELLLEAIYEGYLLHYGTPRLLRPPEADLGLLAGDQLYALGLARLVALGDLAAVAELADVITLTALAHGAGCDELARATWSAGARAVGWGPSERHREAKALLRAGEAGALDAMSAAADSWTA
jgi:hypothetical protein